MQFTDIALDENGQPREGYAVGACFTTADGTWRVSASDPTRPSASEWQVWQHVERALPMNDRRTWRHRLAWLRLPSVEAARAVVIALSALPANASWEVARIAVRDALRTVGAAVFFRATHHFNVRVKEFAANLRARTGTSRSVLDDDLA
jgi:hypothetical protein